LIFDASGRIIHTLPFGTPGGGDIALAFDHAGNLYVAENATIFKNDVSFANLPFTGIGRLAVDSQGNLYLTDPFVSPRVFRIDPTGNVIVFADATQGLSSPYGLAIDSRDNIFVANLAQSGSVSILKFDPSGTVTSFAPDIARFTAVRGMTFDHNDNLYVALDQLNTILKFDKTGNSSVFADASDGLNFPAAITVGTCPVKKKDKEE
jgi:sugar lactone lactonase YvrE